jgi:hypothetical protein
MNNLCMDCKYLPARYIDPTGYRPHFYAYEEEHNKRRGSGYNYFIGGHIYAGSGNHWADGMDEDRDFNLMFSSTFNDHYGEGAAEKKRFTNFIESNTKLSASGASALKFIDAVLNGLSFYIVTANGNSVLISSEGEIGDAVFSPTNALGFTNPTAAVHLGTYDLFGRTSWFKKLSRNFLASMAWKGSKNGLKEVHNTIDQEFQKQVKYNNSKKKPGMPLDDASPLKVPKGVKMIGKYGGWVFTIYGVVDINNQWKNNEISTGTMILEQISNGIGAIPAYGTGWSVGWNFGKAGGPSTWYGRNDYKWFE